MDIKKVFKRIATFLFHPSTVIYYRNFKGTIIYPGVVLKNPRRMKILNSEITRSCTFKCFKTGCVNKFYLEIENSYFGDKCYISSGGGLHIFGATLAPEVFVGSYKHDFLSLTNPVKSDGWYEITIRNHTFIGQKSIIVGSVNIGECCVIGAGSVVTKDLSPYSMAVGNPARTIKRYDKDSKTWVRL